MVTKAFEQVTVDATVGGVALTALTYRRYNHATILVETAPIRVRMDGAAPTTSIGFLVNPGSVIELNCNADIMKFRAIRTDSTSALIDVIYSEERA